MTPIKNELYRASSEVVEVLSYTDTHVTIRFYGGEKRDISRDDFERFFVPVYEYIGKEKK